MNLTDKVIQSLIDSKAIESMPYFYEMATLYSEYYEAEEEHLAYCTYVPYRRAFQIFLNMERLPTPDIPFIIIHEIMHVALGHFHRPLVLQHREINKMSTNIILDFHVNEQLEAEYGGIIKGVDYNYIKELANIAKKKGIKYSIPDLSKINEPVEYWLEELSWIHEIVEDQQDEHSKQFTAGAEQEEQEVQNSIEGMLSEVKEQTGLGQALDRTLSLIQTPIPKLNIPRIKKSMKDSAKISPISNYCKYNILNEVYGYPKKRFLEDTLPLVILAIDVSGSVSSEEVNRLISIGVGITNQAQVNVVFWSCDNIYIEDNIINLNKKHLKNPITPRTNGGTDISTLFDLLATERNHALIVATDMCFPDYKPSPTTKDLKFLTLESDDFSNRQKYYQKYVKTQIIRIKD